MGNGAEKRSGNKGLGDGPMDEHSAKNSTDATEGVSGALRGW
jgi:hypothetical protein